MRIKNFIVDGLASLGLLFTGYLFFTALSGMKNDKIASNLMKEHHYSKLARDINFVPDYATSMDRKAHTDKVASLLSIMPTFKKEANDTSDLDLYLEKTIPIPDVSFNGEYTIRIPSSKYIQYHTTNPCNKRPATLEDIQDFYESCFLDPEIAEIATYFSFVALEKAKGNTAKAKVIDANLILNFVQHIKYNDGNRYLKHPIETLVEGAGKCDDKSFLAASLLANNFHRGDIAFIRFGEDDSTFDHVAVGVALPGYKGRSFSYKGKEYFYGETTAYENFGQFPKDPKNKNVKVIPFDDVDELSSYLVRKII